MILGQRLPQEMQHPCGFASCSFTLWGMHAPEKICTNPGAVGLKRKSMHTHHSPQVRAAATGTVCVPLDRETRTAVDTATAAFHLNRQPQTLRGWAAFDSGPLRPLRVHGRLAWKVADLRRLMGVA